jgi:hypothetical protein
MSVQARGTSDDESPDEEVTTPGTTSSSVRGFSAQLRGVSLWDLVQMECLTRSRLAVQVVGDGGVGYLFFDRGRIVHATTAVRAGEAAALEILGWTNGSFQPCERPWPEGPTILTSHEALILEVARRRDEGRASNLVAFPGRSEAAPASSAETFEEIEMSDVPDEREENMRSTKIGESLPGSDPAAKPPALGSIERTATSPDATFSVVLRLGANGALISNRGGDEDMAQGISYVHRLVQLAGELLGLEPFSALECAFTEGRCIMFAEGEGEVVALRPRPEAALGALRERLGL